MAWANQRVYESIQALPVEALDSFIVNNEWTAGKILKHIVSGADWYLYCLRGGKLQEAPLPLSMADVAALAADLATADSELIKLGQLDDEMLIISLDGQTEQNLRSTIVSQAIYHATEHRAQLVGALEFRGYPSVILDDIDLWAFENFEAGLS